MVIIERSGKNMNIENENVVKLRKSLRMTQEEFSEKAGFSVDTLRKVERGSNNLTLKSAIQIVNAFDVSLDWIYGRSADLQDTASTMLLYLENLFHFRCDENYECPYIFEISNPVFEFLKDYQQATDLFESGKIPEAAYIPWVEKLKKDFNESVKNPGNEKTEYCLIPKSNVRKKDDPVVRVDLGASLGGNSRG